MESISACAWANAGGDDLAKLSFANPTKPLHVLMGAEGA